MPCGRVALQEWALHRCFRDVMVSVMLADDIMPFLGIRAADCAALLVTALTLYESDSSASLDTVTKEMELWYEWVNS